MNKVPRKHINKIALKQQLYVPLAVPTNAVPLSTADAATFLVVSTVAWTVLANVSTTTIYK